MAILLDVHGEFPHRFGCTVGLLCSKFLFCPATKKRDLAQQLLAGCCRCITQPLAGIVALGIDFRHCLGIALEGRLRVDDTVECRQMAHRDRHGEVLVNEHAATYAERCHLYAFPAVTGLSVDVIIHHHQVVAVARCTLALGDAFQNVDRRLQRVPDVADRPLDKDCAVSGNRFRPGIYPGLLVGLRAVIVPAYAESAHDAHAERLGHIRIGLKLLLELLVRPFLLLGILCTEHFPYQRGGQVDHREPERGDYGIFPFRIVNFHIERIGHFNLSD